jgi:uncharacterized RDD family membrane protein YckC
MNIDKDIYSAPSADLDIPREQNVHYAGFWVRVAASIIDGILQLIALSAVGFVIFGESFLAEASKDTPLDFFMQVVFPLLYSVGFWAWKAATPGKMAFNCVLVNASDLGVVSPGRMLLRFIMYWPAYLFFGLGVIWVAFDARKQGWHDKVAGTLVIYR